jgi:hypothetical protein
MAEVVTVIRRRGGSAGPAATGSSRRVTPDAEYGYYDTEPPVEHGAWGRDLMPVEGEFPSQVAAWIERLGTSIVNRASLKGPYRLRSGPSAATIRVALTDEGCELTLDINGCVIGTTSHGLHVRAFELLAELVRRHV